MSLEGFEKECVLKGGVWPGPGPQPLGVPVWNIRWKGFNQNTTEWSHRSDGFQTTITFKKDDDGKLTMRGEFMCGLKHVVLEAVKFRNGKPPGGRDLTVQWVWEGCRQRHRYMGGYGSYFL